MANELNGLGTARHRKCIRGFDGKPCQYWGNRPAVYKHSTCAFDGTELTADKYHTGDCGAKHWDGLVPVDLEAEAAAKAAEAAIKAQAKAAKADAMMAEIGSIVAAQVKAAIETNTVATLEATVASLNMDAVRKAVLDAGFIGTTEAALLAVAESSVDKELVEKEVVDVEIAEK